VNHSMKTALEKMAAAPMASVEVARVTAVEKLHARREIRIGRLDEQVVVVGHQTEGMNLPTEGLDRAGVPFEPFGAVGVVAHDRPLLVAAADDVVEGAFVLDAKRAGHDLAA